MDLRDLHGNSRDGLHMASLAGAWTTLVEGFGGLREHGHQLGVDPALPPGIDRLTFRLRRREMRLLVEVEGGTVTCSLRDGADGSVRLRLCGEDVEVTTGAPVTRPLSPRVPLLPRPQQPPGREPIVP